MRGVFPLHSAVHAGGTAGGADPNIGPRLPGLLIKAGFEKVQMNVVQTAAMSGEVKVMAPLTMENIADAVLV